MSLDLETKKLKLYVITKYEIKDVKLISLWNIKKYLICLEILHLNSWATWKYLKLT